MPLPRFTVDQILALDKSCYARDPVAGRAKLVALFAGRETVDAVDILDANIPADECLWTLAQDGIVPVELHSVLCAEIIAPLAQVDPSETQPRTHEAAEAALKNYDLWRCLQTMWHHAKFVGDLTAEQDREIALFRKAVSE